MPKRILIFSLAYYPRFVSGAEAAVRETTDRIDPSDIEFHMVTLRFDRKDSQEEQIGNVHIHRVGFGASYLSKICFVPLAVLKARALHSRHHLDAMWALMTYMTFPVTLARWCGVRVPYVVTLQDGDPYEKVFLRWYIRPVLPLIDYGFRNAAVFQVISSYLGTWPLRRGYKGPVIVVHNGSDPRDIEDSVTDAEVHAIRTKLGYQGNETYLINTARLEHQKGYDTVFRALAKLPPAVHMILVGSGTEREKLLTFAQELGIAERAHFVGQVERDEASAYRKAAHIFVAPSRSEGLGNAFLSAMATRMPVVSTQEGGLAEFVFDPEHNPDVPATAWVVSKDDPDAIVRAVTWIMEHPEESAARARYAREVVLKDFEWGGIAREMRDKIFARVLKN